jgi:hypothetical protein
MRCLVPVLCMESLPILLLQKSDFFKRQISLGIVLALHRLRTGTSRPDAAAVVAAAQQLQSVSTIGTFAHCSLRPVA